MDHEHKKALLEKHLKDKGEKGTPMSELLQVLPQDNRHDILRMLRDLANDGKAHLVGQRRSAKWYYGHN